MKKQISAVRYSLPLASKWKLSVTRRCQVLAVYPTRYCASLPNDDATLDR